MEGSMRTRTFAIALEASRAEAFAYLSSIDNLPRWATAFCRELKRRADGSCRVMTPEGEIDFRIAADAASGTIDMYGGPTPERMACWPSRVVERPGGKSLYLFTLFQQPGMAEAAFDAQCRGFDAEIANLRREVDGTAGRAGTASDALER
jgi:hypothetical protein